MLTEEPTPEDAAKSLLIAANGLSAHFHGGRSVITMAVSDAASEAIRKLAPVANHREATPE